jgi:hypothetical protein
MQDSSNFKIPRKPIPGHWRWAVILLAWTAVACLSLTAAFGQVSPDDGALQIPERAGFDRLSERNNFPGAMQTPEVKFVIVAADTKAPQLYFMNTKKYSLHFDFIVDALRWQMDMETFNRQTYYSDNRKIIAGSVVAHDHYEPGDGARGVYTLEFWPTDPVTFEVVQLAYTRILEQMPFIKGRLYYHPPGESQRAMHSAQKDRFGASPVRVIQTEELFSRVSYTALNPGETYGRLRIVEARETVSARDIAIFRVAPNTLSHVAGIITAVPQTPLSHVNLKAKQNHTPNAYVRDANTRPEVLALAGKYVRLRVTPEGYSLTEARLEDVNAFFDAIRPRETQAPGRNLEAIAIAPLSRIGFRDSRAFGAKAANVAELAKFLPAGVAPDGFAIPFSYYDDFMKHNGFYDAAAGMMNEPGFRSDPAVREGALGAFRKRMEKGELPDWMRDALQSMREKFSPGTPLRCRSSSNGEDLPGFNGAGLYDSFTHRPDEGHIANTIKQVWASLWTYRAFEERDFFRIDHFQSAMGVLVHPNFDNELANGVAVTKNIFDTNWPGYYVNVQAGEDLVTNPNALSIPDEFLIAELDGAERYEIQYIRHSNQIPDGAHILTKAQAIELADLMEQIRSHFQVLYGIPSIDSTFAMDIEFKITAKGRLSIKQARPWVE